MSLRTRLDKLVQETAPTDPYASNKRSCWLEIAAARKRYNSLHDKLMDTLKPDTVELLEASDTIKLEALGWLVELIIKGHHTTGSPLVMPHAIVSAFLGRSRDFTEKQPQGVICADHDCHRCCYPMPSRFTSRSSGVVHEGYIYDDLLSACPVCGAKVEHDKSYWGLHGIYPSGSDRLQKPLLLYPHINSICDGTRPSDYGVTMPEGWHDA